MEKLIEEFSIGLFFWQTVIFLLLIWLLKKYAWTPILNTINDREEGIKNALESAEKAREEIKTLKASNDKVLKEAKIERDNILKEASSLKKSILEEAKSEAKTEAQKIIEGLTRKVHEGEIFSGVVTRIIPIGAFVEILPGKEGMVHISQLSEARVERVEDVVRQGDEVTVRVREIDSRGRINLTLRGVAQNGGMSYPEPTPTPVAPLN